MYAIRSYYVQGNDAIEKDLGISKSMFDEHIDAIVTFNDYNTKNKEIITDSYNFV